MCTSRILISFIISVLCFISCEKVADNNTSTTTEGASVNINGYIQKGPFINGTSISLFELNNNLTQTGISYNTQIEDNNGSYEFKGVKIKGKIIELKADGFYFNEVSGEKSNAQLTLYALSDITNTADLNVNVLSHLEKRRVEYLVETGIEFDKAKKQAQGEILNIFNLTLENQLNSELLDISKEGEANAVLLAISTILQGHRTESELSELLANISADIEQDGVVDNVLLKSEIVSHAKNLNLSKIKLNLKNRYEEIGDTINIPDFSKYIELFKDSTDYEAIHFIEYPSESPYGINILNEDIDTLIAMKEYSMSANVPIGNTLKIVLRGGIWGYYPFKNENWDISDYTNKSQSFTVKNSGELSDVKIIFDPPSEQGDLTLEYYENGATTPTKIKKITVTDVTTKPEEPKEADTLTFPKFVDGYENILNSENFYFIVDSVYQMAFKNLNEGDTLDITIGGGSWEYDVSAYPAGWYFMEYNSLEKSQHFLIIEEMTFERISFKFLSDDYSSPVEIKYRTVIDGIEKQWIRYIDVSNAPH